jgi:hypothetical protein
VMFGVLGDVRIHVPVIPAAPVISRVSAETRETVRPP